tara:strand:+ start:1674 stop:1898 length:225 start_codon:yes stop_codon:yes gene_type:complete
MACFLTSEIVALHYTGETFAFGYRCYINFFAGLKDIRRQFLADFNFADVVKSQFDESLAGFYTGGIEVSGFGFA